MSETPNTELPDLAAGIREAGFPKHQEGLYGVLVGALLCQTALHVIQLLIEVKASFAIGAARPVSPGLLGELYQASFFVYFMAALIGSVAWFAWIDRMTKNLLVSGILNLGLRPRDAVLHYFGWPRPNLLAPPRDLERLHAGMDRGIEWPQAGREPMIPVWYFVSLAALVLIVAEQFTGSALVVLPSTILHLGSALLALLVLRRFARVEKYWDPAAGGAMLRFLPTPEPAA